MDHATVVMLLLLYLLNSISHVKSKKCDGYGLIQIICFLIYVLFTSMVYLGYSPGGFYIATMQPFVNSKRKSTVAICSHAEHIM